MKTKLQSIIYFFKKKTENNYLEQPYIEGTELPNLEAVSKLDWKVDVMTGGPHGKYNCRKISDSLWLM